MRRDDVVRLREQQREAEAEMRSLLAGADLDRRDLTAEEAKRFDGLELEYRSRQRRLEQAENGRSPQGPPPLAGVTERERSDDSDLLAPEQSLTAWVAERRSRSGLAADFEPAEIRAMSLGRMIRARVTGDVSGLEQAEFRALAEGTDAAGGVLIPEMLSSEIIDRARAQAVIFRAGARTAPMESDTLNLARLATDNTANWKSENAAITQSDSVWEKVTLSAKTVAVEQLVSMELFEDLSDEGERAIRNEIAAAIALKLDLAALEGSGSAPEPRGIANTTGVNSVSMGANGLKPTSYDQVVNAAFAVLKANGVEPTAAIFHPRDLETYALLKEATTNSPLARPAAIRDLPFYSSSQLSTTRTQGTSTDASNGYIGDFRQVIIGVRPQLGVRFIISDSAHLDNLQMTIVAYGRYDVAIGHPEHLTKIVGLRVV